MKARYRCLLLAGVAALAGSFPAGAAASAAAPVPAEGPGLPAVAAETEDPVFVPAPGPVEPVPERIGPDTDLGVHLSSLPDARIPRPSRRNGTWTARILIKTAVRRAPGGRAFWAARTWAKWSGGPQRLMVLGSRIHRGEQWLKVRLPIRPNGTSGWIPRDRVAVRHSSRFLVIDRSRRRLTIYGRGGKVKARFPVVIGKASTPTPVGLFAIYDRVRQTDPRGFIGPWAVPLTTHSNQLRRYDGGPGLVALHGRDGASLLDPLGSARSHGCVRMKNHRIRQMAKIPLGTAVRIRK